MAPDQLIHQIGRAIGRLRIGLVSRRGFPPSSIRARLWSFFVLLTALAIVLAGLLIYAQYRAGMNASVAALHRHAELEQTIRLKMLLSEVDRLMWQREIRGEAIERMRKALDDLRSRDMGPQERESLEQINQRFNDYVAALSSASLDDPVSALKVWDLRDDVSSAVEAAIVAQENGMYRVFHGFGRTMENWARSAWILLGAFVVGTLLVGWRVINLVTRPLSALASHLDQINVEGSLPQTIPLFGGRVPEVRRVSESFQQLLQRLHAYQTLNVKRLLIEKRRADIIAASISDGIFLLRNDEIVYVNPVGERILGLAPGKAWRGLNITAEARAVMASSSQEWSEDGLGEKRERQHKQGVVALYEATSRTIPVELEIQSDQRKLFYLLQSYPISEEVIEQVEHSFDGPIEQLLDRWQANALVLARDITLVKEGQQAKSHFIATLSHEVKTPVTSLTMATRLLRKSIDQIPNLTHRALIETCADDVDRLRGLIDDLLSVSRFDMITQKLEIQNVDVAKLLRQSVQHFQLQAGERGVSISLELPGGRRSIHIPADATKISWAIANLLTNAIRHTPKGGHVRTEVTKKEDVVEIRVRDSGPGIDRSRQESIFDKFNPFYDIRVARSGSVGMGLAIAREIIVAHGGRIWVISEPGQGAEFCFTLPLKRSETLATQLSGLNSKITNTKNGSSASTAEKRGISGTSISG